MTKQDLVNTVAEQTGLNSYQVKEVIEHSLDAIRDKVAVGEMVTLRGFGTFQTKQRKAKPARNINTGETLLVPARKVVVFKPSKDFNADKL
nr:MAG: DNA-binding protein [Bacteriophage sp.]